MRRGWLSCAGIGALACFASSLVAADEEAVVSPPVRIDPGSTSNRFALEFSAVARGLEVAAVWMKRPVPEGQANIILRRAYSADGGVTWTLDDFDSPNGSNSREVDPMTAYDPRTGALWVGAKAGQKRLFVAKRDLEASGFDAAVNAFVSSVDGVDKCWMAAGPKPGDANSTRIYIASVLPSGVDLLCSDDLGETWSTTINANAGFAKCPRVGAEGELYISGITNLEVRLTRSTSLDTNGVPVFLTASTAGTVQSGHNDSWYPGNFRVPRIACIAVDPIDSKKVYAVWADKTDAVGNRVNVDLYWTMTEDATATTVTWRTPEVIMGGEPIKGDQFFPWIEKDAHGRLHFLFMDGRHNPDQKDRGEDGATNDALFDVYYVFTPDDGETWQEHRLTTNSFNVLDSGPPNVGTLFFGDYLGMAVSGKRVYPFYAAIAGDPARAETFINYIIFGEVGSIVQFTTVKGAVQSGDEDELRHSDDQRLVVRSPPPFNSTVPLETIIDVDVEIAPGADEFDIRIEGLASASNVTGTIRIWNFETAAFDLLGTYTAAELVDGNFHRRGLKPEGTSPGGDWDDVRDLDNVVILRLEQSMPQIPSGDPLDSEYDLVRIVAVEE